MMTPILRSLPEFTHALRHDHVVVKNGRWGVQYRWLHRFSFFNEDRIKRIGQAFNKCLDKLECTQNDAALGAAEAVRHLLKPGRELEDLKVRMVALKYRMGKLGEQVPDPTLVAKLKNAATLWRANRPLFKGKEMDSSKIEEACRYSAFAERVLADSTCRDAFFRWIFVYGNTVRPFVLFPAMTKKIHDCFLGARIGFFGGTALKVENGDLTLPFEGRRISILDENRVVTFRGDYQLTIKEVFEVFREREFVMGDLEFLPDGISNWNPRKMAWYNAREEKYVPVDLDKETWWEEVPVIERLTVEEAKMRYGKKFEEGKWVIKINSSREFPTLTFFETHSYLEIAVPKEGGYDVYYFGKFGNEFPRNFLDYFNVLTGILQASVCCPDENIFNLHRMHAGHVIVASDDEVKGYMDSIKKDIIRSREEKFFFQIVTENCSQWIWKKARHHFGKERVPDLFQIPFNRLEADGAIGLYFAVIRRFPIFVQRLIFALTFFLLGGWRNRRVSKKNGKVRHVGVLNTRPWERGRQLSHPPCLFNRLEK